MNQRKLLATAAFILASFGGYLAPSSAFAASQDECAIWICLPGGFPSGCGAAHSAMMDRIEDLKSPLPSFGSCAVQDGSGSQMSYDYNYAALLRQHRECTRWSRVGGRDESRVCAEWETVPSRYVKGTRCRVDREGNRTPRHCVGTYRYVDVFIDGEKAGDTYYWR